MNKYEQLLRENHIKVTPQRLSIVEELYGHIHMSIEELYDAIKKKFPSVSLATVYKNINAMMERGFVTEVQLPHQKSKYELAKPSHSHVVCHQCGKVEDISLDLDPLVHKATNLTHYKIDEEALVLSGLCPECRTA